MDTHAHQDHTPAFFRQPSRGWGLGADLTRQQIAQELQHRFSIAHLPGKLTPMEIDNTEWLQQYPDYTYQHNQWGFRDRELIWDRPFQCAFLGCSVTYGHGVPVDFRYSSLLNMDSYNFGIKGVGYDVITDVFLMLIKNLRFQQCVIMFPHTNRRLMPVMYRPRGHSHDEMKYLRIMSSLDTVIDGHDYPEIAAIRDQFMTLPDTWFMEDFRRHVQIIKALADLKGVRVVFSSWTLGMHLALQDIAQHTNIIVPRVPPPTYMGHSADGLARDRSHPGPQQHQRLAQMLSTVL